MPRKKKPKVEPAETLSTDDSVRLLREWIDFQKGKDFMDFFAAQFNPTNNPIGIGYSTLAVCLVSQVFAMNITPDQRSHILRDFANFMFDLAQNGWVTPEQFQAPPPKDKLN